MLLNMLPCVLLVTLICFRIIIHKPKNKHKKSSDHSNCTRLKLLAFHRIVRCFAASINSFRFSSVTSRSWSQLGIWTFAVGKRCGWFLLINSLKCPKTLSFPVGPRCNPSDKSAKVIALGPIHKLISSVFKSNVYS